jgi:hypothetical protein
MTSLAYTSRVLNRRSPRCRRGRHRCARARGDVLSSPAALARDMPALCAVSRLARPPRRHSPSYPRARAPWYAPAKEGNHAIAKRRHARQPPDQRAELAGRKRGSGVRSGCGGWSRRVRRSGQARDARRAGGRKETRRDAAESVLRARGVAWIRRPRRWPKLRGAPPALSCVLAGASCVTATGTRDRDRRRLVLDGPSCPSACLSATHDEDSAYRASASNTGVARYAEKDVPSAQSDGDARSAASTRVADKKRKDLGQHPMDRRAPRGSRRGAPRACRPTRALLRRWRRSPAGAWRTDVQRRRA